MSLNQEALQYLFNTVALNKPRKRKPPIDPDQVYDEVAGLSIPEKRSQRSVKNIIDALKVLQYTTRIDEYPVGSNQDLEGIDLSIIFNWHQLFIQAKSSTDGVEAFHREYRQRYASRGESVEECLARRKLIVLNGIQELEIIRTDFEHQLFGIYKYHELEFHPDLLKLR